VTTARLETFADGVFAIAATLLIIDVSADAPGGGLGHALTHAWPSFAAYAVSFVTIGIMWVNHHTCFDQIGRADRTLLFLNVGLLACIAFVPYPTRLVAEHLHDDGLRAAALTYGLTLVATSVFFASYWLYAATGRRLLAVEADDRVVRGITRSFRPGVAAYGGATLVALWSPTAAVILFAAIAGFYILESSIFAGELGGR
jgi:uncharacterized membrane protein